MKKACIIAALLNAGIAMAASTTNIFIGPNRTIQTPAAWSSGTAPTDSSNIDDWLIGGVTVNTSGPLVNNGATLYADKIWITAAANGFNTGGTVLDVAFRSGNNGISVQSGFDLAAGLTNTVFLDGTTWRTEGSNPVIFTHNGDGLLKISNNWSTAGVSLVYKGSALNNVEFAGASTYTGGTVLDNVSASVTAGNAIGAGTVTLTNGTVLDLQNRAMNNKIIAAAGSDTEVKTISQNRTGDIVVDGTLTLNQTSGSGQAGWNGAIQMNSGSQLDILNSGGGGNTSVNGALTGDGTFQTSVQALTILNENFDASGFTGTIVSRGTTQYRGGNLGTVGITLNNAANFRAFLMTSDSEIAVLNRFSVTGNSRLAVTATSGLAGNSTFSLHDDIVFNADAALTLEAGGNADNTSAANVLNIYGVIREAEASGKTGSVAIDNHWTVNYYSNSIVKFHAANTYSGKTDIAFGRLQLVDDGSIDHTAEISLAADGVFDVSTRTGGSYTYGGILSGDGLVVGGITLSGQLNPGTSPGELTFDGALTLAGPSVTTLEIGDLLSGNNTDSLTFENGSTLVFDFTGATVNENDEFEFFKNWNALVNNGVDIQVRGLTGLDVDSSTLFSDGKITVMIPEPATLGMLLAGLLMAFFVRQNRDPR
ncbi:MAG: PEP-CTERM sorting domain-containing protein [Kiritimatiellales bacterium]